MRHKIAGKTLNRKTSHRKATVRDIAKAALIHDRIKTTKVKAKEARKLVDKLITLGKKGTLAEKRRAFAILCDHKLVSNLFNETSPRFKDRQGGYTRIIKIGNRRGDNAEVVLLELTEQKAVVAAPAETTATETEIKEDTKKAKTTSKAKKTTKAKTTKKEEKKKDA